MTKKRAGDMVSVIYDRLRADILHGVLAPGTRLSQVQIASQSNASRGPVREALRQLQQDQLVVGQANKRFSVAPFDISDFEATLCLHLANVTLAARVSVPQLTDEEVARLEVCVEEMARAAVDADGRWEEVYREFTLILVRHAGPVIGGLIAQLVDNTQRHRRSAPRGLLPGFPATIEFREIAEAAAARDGRLASDLYAALMSRAALLILASAAPQHDAARLRGYATALTSTDHR